MVIFFQIRFQQYTNVIIFGVHVEKTINTIIINK